MIKYQVKINVIRAKHERVEPIGLVVFGPKMVRTRIGQLGTELTSSVMELVGSLYHQIAQFKTGFVKFVPYQVNVKIYVFLFFSLGQPTSNIQVYVPQSNIQTYGPQPNIQAYGPIIAMQFTMMYILNFSSPSFYLNF